MKNNNLLKMKVVENLKYEAIIIMMLDCYAELNVEHVDNELEQIEKLQIN